MEAFKFYTVGADQFIKQLQQMDGPIGKCLTLSMLPLIGCHPRKCLCQSLTETFKLYSALEFWGFKKMLSKLQIQKCTTYFSNHLIFID